MMTNIAMTVNTSTSSRQGTITLIQNDSLRTLNIIVEQAGQTALLPCSATGSISKSISGNRITINIVFDSVTNNGCLTDKWAEVALTGATYVSGGNSAEVVSGSNNEKVNIMVPGTGTQTIYADLKTGFTFSQVAVDVRAGSKGSNYCNCSYYIRTV